MRMYLNKKKKKIGDGKYNAFDLRGLFTIRIRVLFENKQYIEQTNHD